MSLIAVITVSLVASCQGQFGLPLYDNFNYGGGLYGNDYNQVPNYELLNQQQNYGPNIPSPSFTASSLSFSSQRRDLKCGQTRGIFPASRVVGGRRAQENEFPWQVAIEMNKHDDKESRQFCGATIVSDNWVLTAAHCVQGMEPSNLELEVGSNDITSSESVSLKFGDVYIHEDFDNITMRNDIALIRTQKRIPLDVRSNQVDINVICLPGPTSEFSGRATVTGYGFKEEGGEGSDLIRATDVMILPSASCKENYESFDPTIMLCAGWPDGGRDACQGDSGGPLVQKQHMTDNTVLVGVVSFGKGCARQDTPGVYTRVSAYVDWINDRIRQNDI